MSSSPPNPPEPSATISPTDPTIPPIQAASAKVASTDATVTRPPSVPLRDRDTILPGKVAELWNNFASAGNSKTVLTTAVRDQMIPLPKIEHYEILRELGRGGMGVVYEARQLKLNRTVALKMILAQAHADADDRARFRIEAEAVAKLQHPNIVQIYEIGEHDGLPYFTLEYLPGGCLADHLRGEPQAAKRAAELTKVLALAIAEAHRKGIVHRDLKPANVLLTADGTPKIADFGLAKEMETPSLETGSGVIMGTPSYMAPEQAQPHRGSLTPAVDVYALGAILYEILTGRPPFKGPTALDTMLQLLEDEPIAPSRLQRKIPRDLETICLKCLRKEPAKRYANSGELAEDLDRFLNDKPILARPVALWERLWLKAKRAPARAFIAVLGIAALLRIGGSYWWEATHYRDLQQKTRAAYEQLSASYLDQGRPNEFAAAAEECAALANGDGETLYRLARNFAKAAKASGNDAERFAARAVQLLSAANKAGALQGSAKVEQLTKDAAFESLRGRADFQALVQALQPSGDRR